MEDNEEDADGDNNLPDWAWVHEAGGFQDEPMDEGETNVAQEEPPYELDCLGRVSCYTNAQLVKALELSQCALL